MKNITLTFMLLAASTFSSLAQHKTKPIISVITVTTMNNESLSGFFYSMNDTAVVIFTEKSPELMKSLPSDSLHLMSIPFQAILRLKVHNKDAPLIGALAGGGLGMATGFILDVMMAASESLVTGTVSALSGGQGDPVPVTPAFTITFGLIGTGIGLAAGVSSKKVEIHGSKEMFEASRTKLLKYTYR